MMRVQETVADALAGHDVRHLFGVGASAETGFVHAYESTHCRFVSVGDTSAAVSMADGYSRASGKVGVVAIDPLFHLAHAIASLVEAVRSRTPLVVLCPGAPAGPAFRSPSPTLWIAGVGAAHDRVYGPGSVIRDLNRAFQTAVADERPVVV